MSRNPKTVMKEAAALKAQLAAEKEKNGKLSDALGKMLDEAAAAGRRAEYFEDRLRGRR